jgi:hypothetical protein
MIPKRPRAYQALRWQDKFKAGGEDAFILVRGVVKDGNWSFHIPE